jgi:dTDP-glucose 4,6-dehydratase
MRGDSKMRILVTGGAGFIGSNFVRRVLDGTLTGIESITVLDKLTYAGTLTNFSKEDLENIEFIKGDICDDELLNRIAPGHDAMINFAAESHVDRSINGAKEFIYTNVLGTQTLLDVAKRSNTGVFVQISTDEVYGSIPVGSWTETQPLLPNSPYAASKASADLIARSYNRTFDMDVRITRCSNNFGPYQYPEKVIPLFATNLIQGKKLPVYGAGINVRDWLHVDDHCSGINDVLQKGKSGEIYNIGGGTELRNIDLAHKILALMSRDVSEIGFVEDRLGHDLRYSVDITKISNELGYKPTVEFDRGLQETIAWYEQNESWWRPLIQSPTS